MNNSIGFNSSDTILSIVNRLADSNFHIDIPNISISTIKYDNQEIDGFKLKLKSSLDSSKSGSLTLENITDILNLKLNIELSNELLSVISSNMNAIVMMMILQPMDVNGKKVYDIELRGGELKVNGNVID